MSTTMISMCVSVRGAIRNLQHQRGQKTGFQDDKGKPLNKQQAIDSLMDELAAGRETLPLNKRCGKPCGNSPLCKGFDFGAQGGCPGYPVEAAQ